ncbi:uncharacterized protein LOC120425137 [Culex pipiens pallens]|uniref:uncharacterized protein LOC120425137 n=1 Tax=Culex pipiens pallens TaxID=42434 RepID=UPI001952C94A|nr:uncharacterized protein LOC120425137 [Culex pipiens pallens]
MRQVNRCGTCWLLVIFASLVLLAASSEARRVRRQQPSRNPFTTFFPPSGKFVRNRPLPSTSASASPYLNSSPFSTSQPVRTSTFLGQSVNELTTAPIRVVSRPQQNNSNLPPPLEPRKPNRSRDFYGCLSNCLTLSHYNPVCGTDHTTYHNVYKLDCANRCGARPRVQVRRPGIC